MQVIFCTTPNMKEAKNIARVLVQEKRAACVNIIPGLVSVYEWEGKIVEDNEVLLVIKTQEFDKVATRIKELHSYEVPEIISFEVDKADEAYAAWVKSVVGI